VAVTLFRNSDAVTLEIRDQGIGVRISALDAVMALTATPAPMGVGIAGMRGRVRQLRGHLDISRDARGTTVRAVLPLIDLGRLEPANCCEQECYCPSCGPAAPPDARARYHRPVGRLLGEAGGVS
jgi:signal transduction histidine kinase